MNSCLATRTAGMHDALLLRMNGARQTRAAEESAVLSPLEIVPARHAGGTGAFQQHCAREVAPVLSPQHLCREYVTWHSKALDRRMELLVFGHGGVRVLVFPTRRGRFFEYEDGGLVEALRPRIEEGWIQLFCVDGIDAESVYNNNIAPPERIRNHVRYEQYVVQEVLPFTQRVNPNPVLVAHGASLGAWHALNVAMRHPALFHRAVCLSGRYDLTASMQPDFYDLFDGYYDQTIYYHTPLHYLPRMEDAALIQKLQRVEVTLVIGESDPFLENNRDMSKVLGKLGVKHELHIWSGRAHRFARWKEMVPLFL